MKITLRQLEYFIMLAETRHFGRAAELSGVSQPALSVQIQELEGRLGAKLIERKARQVVLTQTGREVLRKAQSVCAEVTSIEQVARLEQGLMGQINIGVIPTVAPYLLPPALGALRKRYPEMRLGVREAQTQILLSELEAGRLDAVVAALPSGFDGGEEVLLFEDPFLLAGNAKAMADLPETLNPSELDPERLLLLDEGHCLSDQALEACALERMRHRIDLRASSLSTLCGLVALGQGLTLVPRLAAETEMKSTPDLVLRPFPGEAPLRRVGLIRRKTEVDDTWFDALAAVFRAAGNADVTTEAVPAPG
ncbi:hydrogen peroxide-inducible genes activator [Algicella marina]|uniref:LysR family transcriptional regulator n=1 Tax=Algicella marina TaxID=2683284 RepID=A0A6P1SZ68_9RHOB|nr:hydrogen peroxide-inducible genes activator [Algicella marina]QHQ34663.1 LysR family transcriptional regulator [Algicella marina]